MTTAGDKPEGQEPRSPDPGSEIPRTGALSREELLKLALTRRIGQLLVAANLLTKEQLDEAQAIQSEHGGEIIDILFSLDYIQASALLEFLLRFPGLVPNDLAHFELDAELIGLLPPALARRLQVIPIYKSGQSLTLGAVSLLDSETVRALEKISRCQVKLLACQAEDVRAAIARYYPGTKITAPVQVNGERDIEEGLSEEERARIMGLGVPLRLSHVAHLIRKLDSLPALPETVNQVREAVGKPDCSVPTVVDIITLDPPIAAKVLSVANSAAYGFVQRINDLNLAVSLLGLRETYAIVLSAAIADLLNRWKNFDYREFWLESMCCAAAARIVAKASGRRRQPGAFAAGLLHDIGRAALWEVVPQLCAKVDPKLAGRHLLEAEEQVIGISHAEAGFELACHWNLPGEISEPIRFHHAPSKAVEAKENVAIVALADAMVRATGSRFEDNTRLFEEHKDSLAFLGIDMENTEAMLAEYLERRESALRESLG